MLDMRDKYEVELTLKDMSNIKDILSYYCDIKQVRDAELSTIWSTNEECYNIRKQYIRLLSAMDYLLGDIELYDFIDFFKYVACPVLQR